MCLPRNFLQDALNQRTGFGVLSMIYVGFKPCSEARLASQIEIYTQSCSRPLPSPTLPCTIRMANNKQQILASTKAKPCHLGTRMRLSELCFGSWNWDWQGNRSRQAGAGAGAAQHHPPPKPSYLCSSPGAPLRSIQFAALHNLRCRIRLFLLLLLLLLDYGKAA